MHPTSRSTVGQRRAAARLLPLAAVFAAGIATGELLDHRDAGANDSLTGNPAFATLEATWNVIHEEWPLPDEIDPEDLIYGAAAGMVDALGDDGHSRFMDPEEAQSFDDASKGEYTGIGVEMDFRKERPTVVAPFDGSPAARAGIRSGDILMTIDGTDTGRIEQDQVADLLLGEKGTQVTVEVLTPGADATRVLTLTRDRIVIEPISWRMLPGNIAQIRLAEFSGGATRDLRAALGAAKDAGATGIVLDLRDNPGGLLNEAVGVASQFLPEGTVIFQQQNRDGSVNPVKTVGRNGEWQSGDLAVLINGGSASAAEIVGGAIASADRGTTFGEQTYGTGTVLVPFDQADGSSVLIGTALWLDPDGNRLWKEGVAPEKVVEMPLDAWPSRPVDDPDVTAAELAASEDVQLTAAVESLGSGTTGGS
jgi:carboxyl-terminal processing protease